ncbi:MAG: helix-turn-helix domain-containing protein [Rhodocyclales bacterium]|nr:helix-turn-helix domain-containing protein [Rhodocyclales bacterium]
MSEIDNFEAVPAVEHEATEVGPSLGERLREARLARGMSVDDVVHALKFSARQIEAIEADRMDIVPGSVFLRGLVRSYARLLKIDPEPLLDLIEAQAPVQEPDIRAPENMGNATPRGGIHQIPPLVALSVLLLIVAGAMIGWHFMGGGSMAKFRSAVDSARTAVEDLKPLDAAKPDRQPATPAVGAAVLAPQAEVVAAPAVEAPVAAPVQAPPDVAAPPAAPAAAAVAAGDGRRLSFHFQGESWIEVKDASGLVILTGIYHAGTQSVVGRAPFEVVIGSASVVTLRDDGRSVDLRPYTRSEVARLTLQ